MVKKILSSRKIIGTLEEKSKDIKKYDVKKIGLFGSFAKDKQRKKSNIDIIVTFSKETFDNYTDLLLLLERLFKMKIDLVIENDLNPRLNYVKKEAKYVRL